MGFGAKKGFPPGRGGLLQIENLLINPGWDTGSSLGWIFGGTNNIVQTTYVHSGPYALRKQAAGSEGTVRQVFAGYASYGSRTFTFSGFARNVFQGNVEPRFQSSIYDGVGTTLVETDLGQGTLWVPFSVTRTIVASPTTLQVRLSKSDTHGDVAVDTCRLLLVA